MAEDRITLLMKKLGCSEAEARDVLEQDKVIDRGGRTEFDLDPEREKMAKKMANVEGHRRKGPTVFKFDTKGKTRKENPTKARIIQMLAESLKEYENVEITNKERQISFSNGDDTFELTLVQKRKPKK